MEAECSQEIRKGIHEEIKVFEQTQNYKIQDDRKDKPLFASTSARRSSYLLRDQEVHRRAASHQCQKSPIPPPVEEIAREQQKNILFAVSQSPVSQNDRDQKDEIYRGVEKHSAGSVDFVSRLLAHQRNSCKASDFHFSVRPPCTLGASQNSLAVY